MSCISNRNVIFGMYAFVNELLSKEQVILAFEKWTENKNETLGDIALKNRWMDNEKIEEILSIIETEIARLGGERQVLQHLSDHDDLLFEINQKVQDRDVLNSTTIVDAFFMQSKRNKFSVEIKNRIDESDSPILLRSIKHQGGYRNECEPDSSRTSVVISDNPVNSYSVEAENTEEYHRMPLISNGDSEPRLKSTKHEIATPAIPFTTYYIFSRSDLIGEGSMGEIYIARDSEFNRTIALKIMKGSLRSHNLELAKTNFLLEAEITGKLDHPGIIPIFGLGKTKESIPYYSMKLLNTPSLHDLIKEFYNCEIAPRIDKTNLKLRKLIEHLRATSNVIQYTHDKGVLHCDLKPSNIMTGNYGETYVVDWGLALIFNPLQNWLNLETQPLTEHPLGLISEDRRSALHRKYGGLRTHIGGTPAFMSPDHHLATRSCDISLMSQQCDIFSLGVILYQILTGTLPYCAQKNEEGYKQLERLHKADYVSPRAINPRIDRQLDAVCMKAIARQSSDRYHTVQSFIKDLEQWLADESVSVYHENFIERSRRWSKNNRSLSIAFFISVIFMTGAILFFSILQNHHIRQLNLINNEILNQKNIALSNESLARKREKIATSRKLASESSEVRTNRPQLATLLSVESFNLVKDIDVSARNEAFSAIHKNLSGVAGIVLGHHDEPINHIVRLPDGRIATSSRDSTVRIWDLRFQNSTPLILSGHKDRITKMIATPDGRIITGSRDKTIRIWSINGQSIESKILNGHEDEIHAFAIYDTNRLVSGSRDKTIRIWDLDDTEKLPKVLIGHEGSILSLVVTKDNKLVSAGFDQVIRIWDLNNPGMPSKILSDNKGWVNCLILTTDGRIVSGGDDNIIRIWDLHKENSAPVLLVGHTDDVICFDLLADGRLVSAGKDATVRIWDIHKDVPDSIVLKGHSLKINCIVITSKGKIVTGSNDNTILVWDSMNLSRGHETLKGHDEIVTSVVETIDGNIVSGSFDRSARFWNLETPVSEPLLIARFKDDVNCYIQADDDQIVTGHKSGMIRFTNQNDTSKTVKVLNGHNSAVRCMILQGKWLISGSEDHQIQLWDYKANAPKLISVAIQDAPINHLRRISKKSFVSSEINGNIKFWSIDENGQLKVLHAARHSLITCMATTSEDELITGHSDGMVLIWSKTSNDIPPLRLDGHTREVRDIIVSQNGKIITCSSDNSIRVWSKEKKSESVRLDGHGSSVVSIKADKSGRLISGSYDNTVRVWDLNNLEHKPIVFQGHSNSIFQVEFLDENRIISASEDKSIRIWDCDSPASRPVVLTFGSLFLGFYKTANNKLVAIGRNGEVLECNLDFKYLLQHAARTVGRNFSSAEWLQFLGDYYYRRTFSEFPDASDIKDSLNKGYIKTDPGHSEGLQLINSN